jgi:hypothetical protein
MVALFSALFFSLAALGALALTAMMLRRDFDRIVGVLSGAELRSARAQAPAVRVRLRAWPRAERPRLAPVRRAAAA